MGRLCQDSQFESTDTQLWLIYVGVRQTALTLSDSCRPIQTLSLSLSVCFWIIHNESKCIISVISLRMCQGSVLQMTLTLVDKHTVEAHLQCAQRTERRSTTNPNTIDPRQTPQSTSWNPTVSDAFQSSHQFTNRFPESITRSSPWQPVLLPWQPRAQISFWQISHSTQEF